MDSPKVPADLRENLRRAFGVKRDDIALVEEVERLRHHLGALSADMKKALFELLQDLADDDALTSEQLDMGLEQYEATYWEPKGEGYRTTRLKDVRSDLIRELTEWWVAQGRPVTKTLQNQNPTGGDSPVIQFLCAEYKEITGRGITGAMARTELEKLGY